MGPPRDLWHPYGGRDVKGAGVAPWSKYQPDDDGAVLVTSMGHLGQMPPFVEGYSSALYFTRDYNY